MGQLLADAWRLQRPHLVGLAAVSLAVLLPIEVLIAVVNERRGVDSWESYALIVLITFAMGLVIGIGVLRVTPGSSWSNAAAAAGRRLGAIVALSALACSGIIVGLILLVVPGVLLATWWLIAYQTLLVEQVGPFDALARSRALVRGRFALALGALALTVIAYVLPWALDLTSDNRIVDVAAVTLADVLSTITFVAVTTSLYRLFAGGPSNV